MKKANAMDNLLSSLERILAGEGMQKDLEQARISLLDFLGVCLGGAAAQYKKTVAEGDTAFSFDRGEYRPLGSRRSLSLSSAAFLNGFHGHVLELDDGHRRGMCHAGVPVIGALMALAPVHGLDGDDVLRAIVAGYETTLRLACSVQPSHKKKGFHTSATCGTLGAAAACVCALGGSRQQMKRALTAAVTNAGGTLALQDDPSQMKPVNLGRAAAAGVLSAQIGSMTLQYPEDVLGGPRGFLSLYAEDPNMAIFAEEYDDPPMIRSIYRKMYAACRHAHPPADCAFALLKKHDLQPDRIEKIIVRTHKLAIHGHDHKTFDNASSAKLSIPYAVACVLVLQDLSEAAFAKENLLHPEIRRLCAHVEVREDPSMTAALPKERGAAVQLVMKDGERLEYSVPLPKGEPEFPFTASEIEAKTRHLLRQAGLDEGTCDQLIHNVYAFGKDNVQLYQTLQTIEVG